MGNIYTLIFRKMNTDFRTVDFKLEIDRALGKFIQNAHYKDDSILSQLEEICSDNFSFFLRPDYFEYDVAGIEFLMEFSTDESYTDADLNQLKIDSADSWVEIEKFLHDLNQMIDKIQSICTYFDHLRIDHDYWRGYFSDGQFIEQLKLLVISLKRELDNGYHYFSFNII